MSDIVTSQVLPTTLVELNIYELKKILKRRLKEIKELGEPDFDDWSYPKPRIQTYEKYYASIKSISATLYAMQNLLETYINKDTKELEKQKAKTDNQREASDKAIQAQKENAE